MTQAIGNRLYKVNRKINCSVIRFKYKLWDRYMSDNNSGMGVVEVILIILVLVGLVIIFKSKLTTIVNKIFNSITTKVNNV